MKEGGLGGANTLSGLRFEVKADLVNAFHQLKGYKAIEQNSNKSKWYELYFKDNKVAEIFKKHSFYKVFLKRYNIDWKKYLSTKLLPDQAIYVLNTNRIFIIEMKFQEVGGSVDEKLQTCKYKKQQYEKLLSETDIKVEYCYILSNYFEHTRYKDVKEFIKCAGCDYFIENLPFQILGIPEPEKDN